MKYPMTHLHFCFANPRTGGLFSTAGLLLCMVVLSGLMGCNVGPKYVRPEVLAPPAFKELGPQNASDGTTWKPAQPQDAARRGRWWEIYQEPELNALE